MIRRFAAPFALLILYLVLIVFANHRHLWHDELYTFYIASAPTLPDLWKDLQLDMNPPLLYLLSRACMGVLGNTAFAVRLPSIIAFFGGSMCLYELVRRRLQSSAYAALAVLVFWASPAFYFATEARPYALILGFFGLAMLMWWRDSPRALILGAAVAGMMLSHFFAILFLSPFLIAEGLRFLKTQRVDWPSMAALLLPCVLPFFFLKLQAGAAFPDAFRAGLRKMVSYYYWTLREDGLLLLACLCAAALVYSFRKRPPLRFSRTEVSFTLALLGLPIIVNLVIMSVHGAFFTRYSAPTLFVFPLLFVALPWINTNRIVALALCVPLAIYAFWYESKPILKHADFSLVRPDLPLVAASGLTFLEMDHEEPAITVRRLYYLTDRTRALSYAHATLLEGLPASKERFPIRGHVEPFETFTRDHRQFLVLGTPDYAEDWLLRSLMADHATVKFLGRFPSEYKDSQLFLVEL